MAVLYNCSLFSIVLAVLITTALAEIRSTQIRSDSRSTIPFDEFGYTHFGRLNLTVTDITLSHPKSGPEPVPSELGFFLVTREAWQHVLEQLQDGDIRCTLHSDLVKRVLTFDQLQPSVKQFNTSFNVGEANQFTLVFANCMPNLEVSMNVHSVMYNYNPKSGNLDFLSAGKTALPVIYYLFFVVYVLMGGLWVFALYKKRLSVYGIHFFMLAVVILKALNLLCEAEDKSYIKKTGTAHGWDVLFYIFSFLKGITLFTLIVLIGTGWSFLKPYLQDKEKKVLMIVIPLQVVANLAQVVIDETGPFGENSYTWKQVFLLVDIVCCCAVLFPIVWSIKNLREAAKTDGKAAVNLMKLTLFRQYYVIVICYIYFTRVVVYALETITSYRYQWTSVVAAEAATLAFYVFTGYNFRPKTHNPYFAIDDEEEEAASEALKLEDEFEL
ncbi:protein CANDIDATE G-PROTEIN COUPLED RECEPTOR 7-like [Lycium ferocissimum]|uniref:protein CANDIDATE G-PROTEIN COUPLED RECEPTOR 7-like n=1 Tax=Lycium ferocissimum TaxID=112874 RepID=UPI0028164BE2|nr:protein CANDIDATE G-PROTEIN COUPLED RECEPTOR 7-like [Lycium ferocissimum]